MNTTHTITAFGCEPDEAALFKQLAPMLGAQLTVTTAPLSESTIALASTSTCVSISHKTLVTHSTLQALAKVGVTYISTRSAGYNHLDVDFARRVGITVANVAYSPDSVADYTIMLLLMAVRNAKSTLSRAALQDFRLNNTRGRELRDMTVGVIGTGRIGTTVINRLQGFGCRVLAYDHRVKAAAHHVSLDKLLQQSDIVTLHTPLNAGTHHLLHRQRIAQLKPGAFVVNTGRGALLDTQALVEALEAGALDGAALDVLEGEEGIFYIDHKNKPIQNRLLLRLQKLPNVVITPHTAYYTDHALRDMIENSIRNCLKFKED